MTPTKRLAGFVNETEAHSEKIVNDEVAISVRKSKQHQYQLIIDNGHDEQWYWMDEVGVNTLIAALKESKEE